MAYPGDSGCQENERTPGDGPDDEADAASMPTSRRCRNQDGGRFISEAVGHQFEAHRSDGRARCVKMARRAAHPVRPRFHDLESVERLQLALGDRERMALAFRNVQRKDPPDKAPPMMRRDMAEGKGAQRPKSVPATLSRSYRPRRTSPKQLRLHAYG